MVIKIEEIAERDNQMLTSVGFPVSEDKSTWRYYMNLNGDYHPTDDIMWVTSIDTGEEIIFSKDNLAIHLATYREYASGGYWYDRLVDQYQHQTDLIKGILSPLPYSLTITSENYKILDYNQNLVLWNETQLITELQKYVDAEVRKSLTNEYLVTDDLMLPTMLSNISASVFKAISNIRYNAIGTRYVHDFFIWSHIDSFGDFSKYKASLDRYQTMWLYRNIHWLINNAGKNSNFDYLLENLLTRRNIPLAKYDMVLNTSKQALEYKPEPTYRTTNLNLKEIYGTSNKFVDSERIIQKELPLATDNELVADIYLMDALFKGEYSLHSEVPTKIFESEMVDSTNRHNDTLLKTTYNNWIYLTYKNVYRASVLIIDPKNAKQYRIPTGDTWHIWNYLVNAAEGKILDKCQLAWYDRCLKTKIPSVEELMWFGPEEYITKKEAQDIRLHSYSYGTIINTDKLQEASSEVYAIMWQHKKMYSQFYQANKRARFKNACNSMYESGYAKLTDFETYDQLLNAYELNFDDYTSEEMSLFAYDIFVASTGFGMSQTGSLRSIQSDLIDLMKQLSSYTIQIIKTIEDGSVSNELVNEISIDFPKPYPGVPEYGDVGDFSGVQLSHIPHVSVNTDTTLETQLVGDKGFKIESTSSTGVIKLEPDVDTLKPVYPDEKDKFLTAIRLHTNKNCILVSDSPVVDGSSQE